MDACLLGGLLLEDNSRVCIINFWFSESFDWFKVLTTAATCSILIFCFPIFSLCYFFDRDHLRSCRSCVFWKMPLTLKVHLKSQASSRQRAGGQLWLCICIRRADFCKVSPSLQGENAREPKTTGPITSTWNIDETVYPIYPARNGRNTIIFRFCS